MPKTLIKITVEVTKYLKKNYNDTFRSIDLMTAFENIDKSKSGQVPHEDAVKIMLERVKDFPENTLRGVLSRFDKNTDNMVDFREFVKFYERMSSK